MSRKMVKRLLWAGAAVSILIAVWVNATPPQVFNTGFWKRIGAVLSPINSGDSVAIDATIPLKVDVLGTPALDATATFDRQVGTVTIANNCIIDMTGWPASGYEGKKTLYITNGGAATITWQSASSGVTPVYVGGSAPSLTAAGLDVLFFSTVDAGATVNCFVVGQDVK